MAKVAIKNENITSFGGIYHIMDVFSKLGFEKLTEPQFGLRPPPFYSAYSPQRFFRPCSKAEDSLFHASMF